MSETRYSGANIKKAPSNPGQITDSARITNQLVSTLTGSQLS